MIGVIPVHGRATIIKAVLADITTLARPRGPVRRRGSVDDAVIRHGARLAEVVAVHPLGWVGLAALITASETT